MFWKRKREAHPLGEPWERLVVALSATTLKVTRQGDSLIVEHPKFSTHVDVVRPANVASKDGPIEAVVQVRTALPREVAALFSSKPEMTAGMNKFATLGALTVDSGGVFVGSRLTLYEAEQAGDIQIPMLLLSVILGTSSLLGAMRRAFGPEEGEKSASAWVEGDFEQVKTYLSRVGVCTAGGLGLTAEFGLREGAVSAAVGDHETALWQLKGDQPHPELGGGLFCLLQLPHQVSDQARLDRVLVQLNQMEMAPHDLPPHFGAWCSGETGKNPAYVTFLPNTLHSAVPGIAANVSAWALGRAKWANAMLTSMGVRA